MAVGLLRWVTWFVWTWLWLVWLGLLVWFALLARCAVVFLCMCDGGSRHASFSVMFHCVLFLKDYKELIIPNKDQEVEMYKDV